MADLSRTIEIIFEGVDRLGSGVDSVTRQLDAVNSSAQGVVDPIAGATAQVLKFEAALIAGGVAATGLAVKLAGDFDAQFREISTLIDAPTEDLDEFRKAIVAYGSESTVSIEGVNQAVYNAISAGVDYTDSLEAVNTAEQLSIAGKASLDETLTVLVSSLNAYGKGMDEAETFSDLLFTTVKNGQTTLPELGSSLANVTGLAATAGVSFEELLAGVATLTATGSGTSEAITQIRAALTALINPSKQARDIANELGIEFSAAALESNGFRSVIDDVAEATGGNTEQMAQLFGSVEALNGVLTLTGLGAESFADNIDAMGESAGATEEAYNKMAGTLEQGNQKIVNAFTGALIAFGDPLIDEFGGIQEAIAEIFNAIGASVSDGQLQEFVELVEGVMSSLEDALKDAAENLPEALELADFDGYINGFEAVRDAIAGLFDNADITTAEGLVSVIQTLGTGVEMLGEFAAGAVTALGPFIENLAELAKWVSEIDPAAVALAGSIGGIAIAASGILAGVGGAITIIKALGGTGGAIPVATKAIGAFVGSLNKLTGPAGVLLAVGGGILTLKERIDEFNKQPINLAKKIEQDLADVENIERDDFSIFNLDNLLAGYQSLKEYYGWGDEAAEDFEVLGKAGEAAALKIAEAARVIGEESPGEVKKLSQEAVNSAVIIGNSARDIESAFGDIEIPSIEGLGDLPDSLDRVTKILDDNESGVTATAEKVGVALNKIREALDAGDISTAQYEALKSALLGVRDSSDEAATSQEALAGEVLTTEEAILKARQAVLDQTLALEELASNERIKKLEFAVDFKIAQVEADAKKVEAILNATSETISSTAEAASSLFGTLGDGGLSRLDEWAARDAIDQQLEIQKEAAEQQERLIDAQIESMRARTQALKNGDGLIKIESDGLEPALEMIMWQVLEKVQLRANAEGAEFLLGING